MSQWNIVPHPSVLVYQRPDAPPLAVVEAPTAELAVQKYAEFHGPSSFAVAAIAATVVAKERGWLQDWGVNWERDR